VTEGVLAFLNAELLAVRSSPQTRRPTRRRAKGSRSNRRSQVTVRASPIKRSESGRTHHRRHASECSARRWQSAQPVEAHARRP
jgi:hypothetical protein